jgi:hypothetical protein
MRSVLNEKDRLELSRRVAALTGSSVPRWGRMTVAAMLAHLGKTSLMALGEFDVPPRGKPALRTFPVKHLLKYLLLYVLPFPKGAQTSPELLVDEPGDTPVWQASLQELIERVGTGPATGLGPAHPLFGPLSRKEWGFLMHKHIDHHLRQFGV